MHLLRTFTALLTPLPALLLVACAGSNDTTAAGLGGYPAPTLAATATPAFTPALEPTPPDPEPTATFEPPSAATPPAATPPTPQPNPPSPPPTAVNIRAFNLAYDVLAIRAKSGSQVSVRFRNDDIGVPHDISFGIAGLAHGNTCVGPCTDSYAFTAPASGRYPFFCTVHADMVGELVVEP